MKRTLIFLAVNVVMIVVTALVAVSCNPDVFIKPLDVSKSEFDVPFYGGSVEVDVAAAGGAHNGHALSGADCQRNLIQNPVLSVAVGNLSHFKHDRPSPAASAAPVSAAAGSTRSQPASRQTDPLS